MWMPGAMVTPNRPYMALPSMAEHSHLAQSVDQAMLFALLG